MCLTNNEMEDTEINEYKQLLVVSFVSFCLAFGLRFCYFSGPVAVFFCGLHMTCLGWQ